MHESHGHAPARPGRWLPAVGTVLLVVGLISGCATSVVTPSVSPTVTASPTPAAGELVGLLPADALPIESTTRYVTPELLGKDAPVPGLVPAVLSMGFLGGVQRNFQGESKHVSLAVSRTLNFADAKGARAFVTFVHANRVDYFGIGSDVARLTSGGRTGWVFRPPACNCHMAQPDVVGVVAAGKTVSWLEINGPDADPALLRELMAMTGRSA